MIIVLVGVVMVWTMIVLVQNQDEEYCTNVEVEVS